LESAPAPPLTDPNGQAAAQLPPIFEALLAAINYALAPWKPEEFGPAYHAEERLEPLPPPWESGAWMGKLSDVLDEGDGARSGLQTEVTVSGIELWQLHMAAMNPSSPKQERKKARGKLRSYWCDIGRQVGILPSEREDKGHSIPMSELRALVDSAGEILKELRNYQPSSAEQAAVRELLSQEPHVPARTTWERIKSYDRAGSGSSDVLAKLRAPAVRQWDASTHVSLWCTRLAFPMLTRAEILAARPKLLPRTVKSVTSSKRGHLWLLQVRFGLVTRRISEELSRQKRR
jgi:hypothetical protein